MPHIEESESGDIPQLDALDHLDRATSDEYLKSMNARANEIESRINLASSNQQERIQYIKELDEAWIYMNRPVEVWGRVYESTVVIAPGILEYQSKIVAGEALTSVGYIVQPFAAILDDEAIVQYKVSYAFIRDGVQLAMMRDNFAAKFPDSTPEMAKRRIEYHYPDEFDRITELVGVEDESISPIMNFTDYQVDFYTHSIDHENYFNDMQTYLFEVMHFDKQLPYVVTCELDEFDDGSDPSVVQIVASPERIVLLPVDGDDSASPRRYAPWIKLSVHDADYRKPNTELTVPLAGLYQFDSVRHIAK
jgi:hypothetical protein